MKQVPTIVPQAAVDAVVHETIAHGRQDHETGGFLLAHTGSDTVHSVALAGVLGIRRRFDLFQISELALEQLFTFADRRGLWIPVQFHSHGYEALMSKADKEHGLCVEGFISTIVPRFSSPPVDPSIWGWWQFHNGDWCPRTFVSTPDDSLVTVFEFDESGVRER